MLNKPSAFVIEIVQGWQMLDIKDAIYAKFTLLWKTFFFIYWKITLQVSVTVFEVGQGWQILYVKGAI